MIYKVEHIVGLMVSGRMDIIEGLVRLRKLKQDWGGAATFEQTLVDSDGFEKLVPLTKTYLLSEHWTLKFLTEIENHTIENQVKLIKEKLA